MDAGEDVEGGGIGVLDVAQEDADGVGGERTALEAEAFKVADAEMALHHFATGGGIAEPGLVVLGDAGRDFAGRKAHA